MINHSPPLDRMFHALADGHRRSIVERLAGGPLTVSDLAAPMDISLPAVMQHLAVLESAGLVVSGKQGRVRTCSLAPDGLTPAEAWLTARRRMVQGRLQRLQGYLDNEKETKR